MAAGLLYAREDAFHAVPDVARHQSLVIAASASAAAAHVFEVTANLVVVVALMAGMGHPPQENQAPDQTDEAHNPLLGAADGVGPAGGVAPRGELLDARTRRPLDGGLDRGRVGLDGVELPVAVAAAGQAP